MVLLICVPGPVLAESCFAPARPFLPSDSQAARDYADIIRGDFEGSGDRWSRHGARPQDLNQMNCWEHGNPFSRFDDHSLIEDQLANIKEARRAVVVNALQPHAAIRSAAVQEVSKQWTKIRVRASRSPIWSGPMGAVLLVGFIAGVQAHMRWCGTSKGPSRYRKPGRI